MRRALRPIQGLGLSLGLRGGWGGMWSAAAHLEEEGDLKITDIIIGFQA